MPHGLLGFSKTLQMMFTPWDTHPRKPLCEDRRTPGLASLSTGTVHNFVEC